MDTFWRLRDTIPLGSTFLGTNYLEVVLENFRSTERVNNMNASWFKAGAEVTHAARPRGSPVPATRTRGSFNPIPFVAEQRAQSSGPNANEPTHRCTPARLRPRALVAVTILSVCHELRPFHALSRHLIHPAFSNATAVCSMPNKHVTFFAKNLVVGLRVPRLA